MRRLSEKASAKVQRVKASGVRRAHTSGPLPPSFHCAQQYKQYDSELFTLKLDQANSHVYIQGEVAKIRNIIVEKKEVYLVYSKYAHQESYFEYPMPSSSFGIHLVDGLLDMTHHCHIGLVEGKAFLIPHGRQFVAVPLIHLD